MRKESEVTSAMNCKVCGHGSGKYPLCRACNLKKERGEIIKCANCNNWHYATAPCSAFMPYVEANSYLYNVKNTLISKSEQSFYSAIISSVPDGYCVFPQTNLASFILRTDGARFHNELFRNVDFLITDAEFCPKFIIEINDQTHMTSDRKERDEKVRSICEEAGMPILKLWTSYGVNPEYIKKRIDETLASLPVARIHHFNLTPTDKAPTARPLPPPTYYSNASYYPKRKHGCYIATAVYGSYDCPPVWTLRRYRDFVLAVTWYGRAFIRIYYAVSPTLVRWFGETEWFRKLWKTFLDKKVALLQIKGVDNTPYEDNHW